MSNRTLAVLVALVAAAVVLYVWPRRAGSPEDEIRALVAECVKSANDKAVGDLTEHIAEDFIGAQGTRKGDVRTVLVAQLIRNPDVAVILNPNLAVTVKSPTEGSIIGFFVFGRTSAKTAEELARGSVAAIYKIEAGLERRDGRWTFVSAQYQKVNGWAP